MNVADSGSISKRLFLFASFFFFSSFEKLYFLFKWIIKTAYVPICMLWTCTLWFKRTHNFKVLPMPFSRTHTHFSSILSREGAPQNIRWLRPKSVYMACTAIENTAEWFDLNQKNAVNSIRCICLNELSPYACTLTTTTFTVLNLMCGWNNDFQFIQLELMTMLQRKTKRMTSHPIAKRFYCKYSVFAFDIIPLWRVNHLDRTHPLQNAIAKTFTRRKWFVHLQNNKLDWY